MVFFYLNTMVVITQNHVNQVVTTLTEKKQSCTRIYLIKLYNETTKYDFFCVVTDKSHSPNRYNLFCVTETSQSTGTTNPYDGQLALPLSGFYSYHIYENPYSSLSPTGLHLVEQGKWLVLKNKFQEAPKYESGVNPKLQVYDPENYNYQT
jgi:hypothetical protein